jgi:hypothetical protein
MAHPGKLEQFCLEKLYLDCIDESGNCFIVYRAGLKIFFMKFHYSRLIFSDSENKTMESFSIRRTEKPGTGDDINFNNRFLKVEGCWKRAERALPELLFSDDSGHHLSWNCHHPMALVKLKYREWEFSGPGYGETLSLSIKPWKLPIDELRWGRFVSDNYNITWVNWKGTHPLNLIYMNGSEFKNAVYDDESEVSFGGGAFRLKFGKRMVVTDGRLSGLISSAPWLLTLFPRRILNVREVKYKSPSTFFINDEIKATGWSLYEDVLWKI